MLIRIVRMEFANEKVEVFKTLFIEVEAKIRNVPGCQHVELCTDATASNVYYTLSHWENETALNNYRASVFFDETWTRTKALFSGKPLAYSLLKE